MLVSKSKYCDYASLLCSEVNRICLPLKQFGISFFSYSQVSQGKNHIYLTNKLDYFNFKFENNLFDGYLFVNQFITQDIKKQIFFDDKTQIVCEAQRYLFELGVWNSIDIYKKYDNFFEAFHFGGTKNHSGLVNFYLENDWILEHFILHFKDSFHSILYENKKELELPSHIIQGLNEPNLFKPSLNLGDFLKETEFSRVYIESNQKFIYLSKKEWICLKHIAQGSTAKETAKLLNISPRTVESHIQKIRQKTNISSQKDWIKFLVQNFTNILPEHSAAMI